MIAYRVPEAGSAEINKIQPCPLEPTAETDGKQTAEINAACACHGEKRELAHLAHGGQERLHRKPEEEGLVSVRGCHG